MPLKIIKSKAVTLPQVKEILEDLDELNQFQRKTLDYASSFTKLSTEKAAELCKKLMDDFQLNEKEAVQIVNCMPSTIEELRVFFPRHRVVETEKLQDTVNLLNRYRKA